MSRGSTLLSPSLILLFAIGCDSGTTDSEPVDTGEPAAQEPDRDQDGHRADVDCDDENPDVHPEAVDFCNGVDDDCDGEVDEDPSVLWYTDADGDGFGAEGEAQGPACEGQQGLVSNHADCDDGDDQVYPGATEDCDGVDDDCDGQIDEGASVFVDAGAAAGGDGSEERPYQTIGEALESGSICISVAPGTYYETTSFTGEELNLASTEGPEVTVIDGEYAGTVLTLQGGSLDGMQVQGFTLLSGYASSGGGLLVKEGDASISDMKIQLCYANYGGGLYASSGTVHVEAVEISECYANYDGGGICLVSAALEGGGLSVTGNAAVNGSGGGLYVEGGSLDLGDVAISENGTNYDGGGLYATECQAWLSDAELHGNLAYSNGGGIFLKNGARLEFEDLELQGNEASSSGGGTYLYAAELMGNELAVRANRASQGGGLYLYYEAEAELMDADISGNEAYSNGGGLLMTHSSVATISAANISNNIAYYVPAVRVYYYSELNLENAIINGNASEYNNYEYGAFYGEYFATINATNVTVIDNPGGSGVLAKTYSDLSLNNAIVAYHDDGYGVYQYISVNYGKGIDEIAYSDFFDNAYGAWGGDVQSSGQTDEKGNIFESPYFVHLELNADASDDDLHLEQGSPCIDQGDPDLQDPDGSRSDMGAYGGPYGNW